jgi:hypothetical protein
MPTIIELPIASVWSRSKADVDMAFSLVDDPRAEYHEGSAGFAHAATRRCQ